MRERTCGALLALVCLLAPADAPAQSASHEEVEVIKPPKKPPPKAKADVEKVVELIVEQTNDFRKEQKRPVVEVSRELTKAARYFADFMAREDRFGHTADGNRPSDRAKKFGYDYCIVLENVAYEYNSRDFETRALAEAFVDGWEDSPGHRRNMLDPDVTQTGVAVARSEKTGYYYAVQTFGRPHSLAIEFQVSNRAEEAVSYRVDGRTFRLEPGYVRTHTRCRPAEVKFRLPGEKGGRRTFRPAKGDQLVVTGDDKGGYQVKKE